MQLIKCSKDSVKVSKGMPGLIEVEFEHTISTTKASVLWEGPPISPEVWNRILSFFRWTWDTTHSESQVRLFVNLTERRWDAWAAPQEARTGMSAREIDNEDAKAQRRHYSDQDGWIYFGTVHHHCSAPAFQSGTDEFNEKTQDGLHITIGNMGSPMYDMHARFYINGAQFDPNMTLVWDIGDQARRVVPKPALWNEIARAQMCVPPTEIAFPDFWRTNLIEFKSVVVHTGGVIGQGFFSHGAASGASYVGGSVKPEHRIPGSWARDAFTPAQFEAMPMWRRARIAADKLMEYAASQGIPWESVEDYIKECVSDESLLAMIEILVMCQVPLSDLWREFPPLKPVGYDQAMGVAEPKKRGRKKKQLELPAGNPPPALPAKTAVSIPVRVPIDEVGNPSWGAEYY